ncbi:MAG TPA: hypothetical protein VHL52_04470, partial [Acidimicrobiia bacterium]|nr:hypothetical protein [Acidimicrobiia bacterium]
MDEHTFGSGLSVEEEPSTPMEKVVDFDELTAGCRLMRLCAVAELDRSKDFEYDGYTSTSAFLIHRCGMSVGEATREVFVARSLDQMDYSVKSAFAGHISLTQLELLAHARARHPDEFAADEATLVDSVS